MKKLILILFFILLFSSCDKEAMPDICWKCTAIIYGNAVSDMFCDEMITDVEDYKARLYEFYQGGCTSVECEILPDTIGQ